MTDTKYPEKPTDPFICEDEEIQIDKEIQRMTLGPSLTVQKRVQEDPEDKEERLELENFWKIKGGPRRLTMHDYHASPHDTYAAEAPENNYEESSSDLITDLSDEEYLFCLVSFGAK